MHPGGAECQGFQHQALGGVLGLGDALGDENGRAVGDVKRGVLVGVGHAGRDALAELDRAVSGGECGVGLAGANVGVGGEGVPMMRSMGSSMACRVRAPLGLWVIIRSTR